jgi:hypothetical protein
VFWTFGNHLEKNGYSIAADVFYYLSAVVILCTVTIVSILEKWLKPKIAWFVCCTVCVLLGVIYCCTPQRSSHESSTAQPVLANALEGWQPPQFATNCSEVNFFLGEGMALGGPPSTYGTNGQELYLLADGEKPIRARINDRRVYVDLDIAVWSQPFIRNVAVRGSSVSALPPFWHVNNCTDAIEIVDGQYTPMYQVWYETADRVHINGIFWATNRSSVISYGSKGNSMLPSDANTTWLGLTPIFKYPIRADSPCEKR